MSGKTEEEILANAPAFDPDKDYSLVHAHKEYRYKQGRIYYDSRGNACAAVPRQDSRVKRGVQKLLNRGSDKVPELNLDNAQTIGSVPKQAADARKENAKAKAAEDLLG